MSSKSGATEGVSSHKLGITFMLVAMVLFTINDTIGKWLVASYPVGELIALRSLAALIVLGFLIWKTRTPVHIVHLARLDQPVLHILRIVLAVAEVGCFYTAVRFLPLADVFMFYLASPLFLTIFSVVLLKERVGLFRWSAVCVGLGGVFFVFPPSEAAFSQPALIALAGSLALALMLTLTRMLRSSNALMLITTQTFGLAVISALTLPFAWVTPDFGDALLICLLGIVATGAHFLMNKSVLVAPSAVVAPFQYTSIIWAIILGYLVWGDFPTLISLFGVALIICSGLIVLYREKKASNN